MSDPRLDEVGEFLMSHFRDKGLDFVDVLLRGGWRSPRLQELQQQALSLTPENAALLKAVVTEAIDGALHDFLFALVEATDRDGERVKLVCRGANAVALSDGLHGEIFGKSGWRARFSKHGVPQSEL